MRLITLSFVILILGCLSTSAQLVSQLNPFPFEIEQENSRTVIHRKGDYGNHWLETTEGYRVFQEQGAFEYAINTNGIWKSSGIKVTENPNGSLRTYLNKNARYLGEQKDIGLSLKSGNGVGGVPTEGEIKLPVICIEYADLKHTRTKEDIERMFNQDGYQGNLSLSEYFRLSSHEKLKLSFEVVGWVSTSDSHAKYAENKGMYNAGYLARKAVTEANLLGVDFSEFDNDKDGDVDCVIIVHAGLGAEEIGDERYIWAHSWSLSGTGAGALTIDGKTIDSYNIGCELRRESNAGIGMKCHELGHALGLPDLYDGTGKSNGLGYWCMMSAAPWLNEARPGNFSAWCRVELGWENPVVKNYNDLETLSLSASSDTNQVVRINTAEQNEYFLLENRQKEGIDYRLPGTGLAIYHCNEEKLNTGSAINDDREYPGIQLVEADFNISSGLYNAKDRGSAGDLFPGTREVTAFSAETDPSSNLFDGSFSGVNLQNIREENDTITFEMVKTPAKLSADFHVFRESPQNGGSISNALEISLIGTEWAVHTGTLSSEMYTINNLPEGLFLNINLEDSITALVQLEGNASLHDSLNSVNNVILKFEHLAFSELEENESLIDSLVLGIQFRNAYEENLAWFEGFELYSEKEKPDGWTIEMEPAEGMEWTVTNVEQINNDAAKFNCYPASGVRALKSVENWFGNGPAEFRFISPEIDFSEMIKPRLSFDEIRGWDNVWPEAKSTHHIDVEFSEDKQNWQTVSTIGFSDENFKEWQNSGFINLDVASGKSGYIALKSSTHTYYWEIDNIAIRTGGVSVERVDNITAKVYPNPATNSVWIESSVELQSAELFNMQGALKVMCELSGKRNQIDIAGILPGIYFLKTKDINGNSKTFKIKID